MKVAILADSRPGFVMPMAVGLKKMLGALDVPADIFSSGLDVLNVGIQSKLTSWLKNIVKAGLNFFRSDYYSIPNKISPIDLDEFEKNIVGYTFVVVVCNIPNAFLRDQFVGIERIRKTAPIPIVLYQNYYLATRGGWAHEIVSNKGFGLERYDWYFAASLISEYPLSREDHPCSLIGHDLRSGSLSVEPNKPFRVLLDFKRRGFERYRQLQIQALEETGIEYAELSGRYSPNEINALYRTHSALFLSFRESFGLPIVENQLCGNYIFTPFCNWAPSHYIDKSVYSAGEGKLGSNFIVYDNDLDKLKSLLLECQNIYSAEVNFDNFRAEYPTLYRGDLIALSEFITQLEGGKIDANTHSAHKALNANIVS